MKAREEEGEAVVIKSEDEQFTSLPVIQGLHNLSPFTYTCC